MQILKRLYRFFKSLVFKFKIYWSINWLKTLYFNFKMLPFRQALKCPVFIYGKIRFTSLKGRVILKGTITKGMIGIGQPYEMNKASAGITEISLNGTLVFKGYCQLGKDTFLHVGYNGICTFGNMASLASRGKLICTTAVTFGDYARLGSECQVIDTNFHDMIDTSTNLKLPINKGIVIGDYNFFSNRVTVMKGVKTPAYTSVASNTLCNKDYTTLGTHVLIGGVPAKLLKSNIVRDWEGERHMLEKSLIFGNWVNSYY